MARVYNKINLPTNTTDIQMFVKYLRAIDEKGIVAKNDEQALFADVKISGSRKDVSEPKRDTHTKQTLSLFGLIDILDDGAFSVSDLGKELIAYYNAPNNHSEEKRVALMLKVFMRWVVNDDQFNRYMHPGYLIVKLLCDEDLNYYFTNHEFANFVMNEKYISDSQYDEIKTDILAFRAGTGISEFVAQSKAGTFLSTLVGNWNIFKSDEVAPTAAQMRLADRYFSQYLTSSDDITEDTEDIENSEVEISLPNTTELTASQRNAYSAYHTIKKYSLIGIASYISHLYLYLQEGTEIVDYKSFFTNNFQEWEYKKEGSQHIQRIYYGAPGTGKSYKIKNEIIPSGCPSYRVTFYSDYYYSDFVGGLRPAKGENGVEYRFEPGPFAKALLDSFSKPTYLIIEEINRGNAAAIFGDIFQLLDRKGSRSDYSITNHDLYQYLVENGVKVLLEKDKVYLPENLNIICTMNTADQNVFVLDTAFKRRFKMEYVPINFNSYYKDGVLQESCKGYVENCKIFNDVSYEQDLKVIMSPELFRKVEKVISNPSRNWPTFAAYVNAKIDAINSIEQKISEDKKLGPFFVDPDELEDRKLFADKVLYYLKQDVFKYEDNILDESYEDLYDNVVNKGADIFGIFDPIV